MRRKMKIDPPELICLRFGWFLLIFFFFDGTRFFTTIIYLYIRQKLFLLQYLIDPTQFSTFSLFQTKADTTCTLVASLWTTVLTQSCATRVREFDFFGLEDLVYEWE